VHLGRWAGVRLRLTVAVLLVVLAVYLGLLGTRGVLLVRSGDPAAILLGVGVLLLPVLGVGLVFAELRFGTAAQRLARTLAAEGGLRPDVEDGRRRPGRGAGSTAAGVCERRRVEVERNPGDWRAWFRLGVAYDDAGDRRRGRAAVHRAIALHRAADRRPPTDA